MMERNGSGVVEVLAVVLIFAVLVLRVVPLPRTVVTFDPPVVPKDLGLGQLYGTVLDTSLNNITGTRTVDIGLAAGVSYSWFFNVTSGKVSVSLSNGIATFWEFVLSSPAVWAL